MLQQRGKLDENKSGSAAALSCEKARLRCAGYNRAMEPVTTLTAALGLARAAGEITNKLNDIYKNLKDRDAKQQVAELLDQMQELKRSAYALEDENRNLREQLRFKTDAFEFRNPFWYEKSNPQQPFYAKCFAKNIAAPMSEVRQDSDYRYRRCLVCASVEVVERSPVAPPTQRDGWNWS